MCLFDRSCWKEKFSKVSAHNKYLEERLHEKAVREVFLSAELNQVKDSYKNLHNKFVEKSELCDKEVIKNNALEKEVKKYKCIASLHRIATPDWTPSFDGYIKEIARLNEELKKCKEDKTVTWCNPILLEVHCSEINTLKEQIKKHEEQIQALSSECRAARTKLL